MISYTDFFFKITGGHQPFPFQVEYAQPAQYTALIVPTGLGKTQTVLADWLFRRPTTRLLWILPGRALTAQVAAVAREMVQLSGLSIKVLEWMGGSKDLDSPLTAEEPAIIVATLDIAISRALNRGYASTPFRWPIDFGLLNNDTQWVIDEVQLQGDALSTSAQLAGFRANFKVYGEVPCTWISATFDPSWLKTVDFPADSLRRIELRPEDYEHRIVRQRFYATKKLEPAPADCATPKGIADFLKSHHRQGQLSLVIVNTVSRAIEVQQALKALKLNPLLLHSRFRQNDRNILLKQLEAKREGIIVSTQVIEAGIDLDADLLITDPAPWASLVQRFGRVNRRGDKPDSEIYWIERPLKKDKKPRKPEEDFAPYAPDEVERAIERLKSLTSASPADLPPSESGPPYTHVIRRADLLDLFDTTPDLAGNHLDISRFVRSGEDTDVYIAWRDWPDKTNPERKPAIAREEICPVPQFSAQDFLDATEAWTWSFSGRGKWERRKKGDGVFPGMRFLVRSSAGGYTPDLGWQGKESKSKVEPVLPAISLLDEEEPSVDEDPDSVSPWQTLEDHTADVVERARQICGALQLNEKGTFLAMILDAARLHDWGKVHDVFQETMRSRSDAPAGLLAKTPTSAKHKRKGFRHELASALAALQQNQPDLVSYVIAAHHGKVRMNIRSLPDEDNSLGTDIARGIRDGEILPACFLGPEVRLSLAPSKLGPESWTAKVSNLLHEYGPFRLAYLEMLLRHADTSASAARKEQL